MIAKYPGKCSYCGKPITVGTDTYNLERKCSYHERCREESEENGAPSPEQIALADRLGFLSAGEPLPASWFRGDRVLPQMPEADQGTSARGLGSKP